MTEKNKQEKVEENKEYKTDSLTDFPDERFFGVGETKQNNIHLSYYENFLHYNKRK